MEAISDRIKQLENFETGLHFKWQATIQQRLQEDVVRTSNRQAEDQYYLDQLQRRDEEEDVSILLLPVSLWSLVVAQGSREKLPGSYLTELKVVS